MQYPICLDTVGFIRPWLANWVFQFFWFRHNGHVHRLYLNLKAVFSGGSIQSWNASQQQDTAAFLSLWREGSNGWINKSGRLD